MTDDPWFSPTWKPPAPRQTRHGEPLWELRKDHHTYSCELRVFGVWGVEAQILKDGELLIGRRFQYKGAGGAVGDARASSGLKKGTMKRKGR